MMPTMLDPVTIDLGGQFSGFGWTLDASMLAVLGALLVPWVLLCFATIVGTIDRAPATESIVVPPAGVPTPLRLAA